MPKIIINEFDKTDAGFMPGNNFSVAVPGLVAAEKYSAAVENAFDENGIYVCSSAADFIEKIGLVPIKQESVHVPARYCEYTEKYPYTDDNGTPDDTTDDRDIYLTWKKFVDRYIDDDDGEIYTRKELTDAEIEAVLANGNGRLIGREELHQEDPTAEPTFKYYRYTKVDHSTFVDYNLATGISLNDITEYFYIPADRMGSDAIDTDDDFPQMGNQIAYTLLSLGYTVLYINLGSEENLDAAAEKIVLSSTYSPLKDKSIYDFRYILTGLFDGDAGDADDASSLIGSANMAIASVVNGRIRDDVPVGNEEPIPGRGDCVALLDIAKSAYTNKTSSEAITAIAKKAVGVTGAEYCAFFAPTVTYKSVPTVTFSGKNEDAFRGNREFPGSVHYLVCSRAALARYPEWFAVSGYTRGIGDLSVEGTSVKLGDGAVNALQPRKSYKVGGSAGTAINCAVNLIINLNGVYYLWGNRTA